MDYTLFINLISEVGLPIAIIIAMAWFIYKIYKKSEEREDSLRAEIKENQEINAQAVTTLALYAERLGSVEKDVKEIKTILISTDVQNTYEN